MEKMKRIIAAFLVITSLLLLISCSFGQPSEEQKDPENLIYNSQTDFSMVIGEGVKNEDIAQLWENIGTASGKYAKIVTDSAEPAAHEIVFGKTNRPVSEAAYRLLDRMQKSKETDQGIIIYSSGSSIAVAFDSDDYGITLGAAIAYLLENCVAEELLVPEKTMYSYSFDLLEYISKNEEEAKNAAWKRLEQKLGEHGGAIVSSLRSFYGLYGAGLVTWMADLYDPDICVCDELYGLTECTGHALCGTAGFHYTSSARDTVGYLPVVEAMNSVLGFVESMGLADDAIAYFPEAEISKMASFVKNLQDPDGYFYHPQWGKSINDSRRGRDLNSSVSLLAKFGVKPTYPTISDVSGASFISEGALWGKLSDSRAELVSRVILTETYIPEHLRSISAFKAYLQSLDVNNRSYSVGNTLVAQIREIMARGEEYIDSLETFLNDTQLDNGLWQEESNYDSINGLMKISGVYDSMGREIPRAELGIKAALDAISSYEEPHAIVSVWNPWSALTNLLDSIGKHKSEEALAEVRGELLSVIPEAIDHSKRKLSIFLKTNGAYSYYPNAATDTMQNAPCSVPGVNEGDMDGAALASFMITTITDAIGARELTVPVYTSAESIAFMEIIKSASPIRKASTVALLGEPTTFDDEPLGKEVPSTLKIPSEANYEIVADPRENAKGNVLYFDGTADSYEYINVYCENPYLASATCYVYESELCFLEKSSGHDSFRIMMGEGGDPGAVYMILFKHNDIGVELWDSSSVYYGKKVENDLGLLLEYGEWFKIRIEYYLGTSDTARAKIYINDKLQAVTDNYYDATGEKIRTDVAPNTKMSYCLLYPPVPCDHRFYLDNVTVYKSNDVYIAEELEDRFGVNADMEPRDELRYDFESAADGNFGEGISYLGRPSIVELQSDKKLSLGAGASLNIPANLRSKDASCASISLDLLVTEAVDGDVAAIYLNERNLTEKSFTSFTVYQSTENGDTLLKLREDTTGRDVLGVSLPVGESATLRIDYYESEKVLLFYVNGVKKGISTATYPDIDYLQYGRVRISAAQTVCLDNVVCEYTKKSLDEAMAPKYPSIVHGKDGVGFDALTLSGAASVIADGDDVRLSLNSGAAESAATLAPNVRDDAVSLDLVEFTVKISSAQSGRVMELHLVDDFGDTVLALAFYSANGRVSVRELTALGAHKDPVFEFGIGRDTVITLEYFALESEYNLLVDGKCVFVGSLFYTDGSDSFPVAKTKFITSDTASTILLDDIRAEKLSAVYIPSEIENVEEKEGKLSFSHSGGSNLPDSVKSKVTSPDGRAEITEIMKNGSPEKVFALVTTAGGGDEVTFAPMKTDGAISYYAFESDLCFIGSLEDVVHYELNMISGQDIAHRIGIFTAGGMVSLAENDSREAEKRVVAAPVGEWFRLRIEYGVTDVDGELTLTVRAFVNGEAVYESCEPWVRGGSTEKPVIKPDIDGIQIYGLSNRNGTVYIDNVTFDKPDNITE